MMMMMVGRRAWRRTRTTRATATRMTRWGSLQLGLRAWEVNAQGTRDSGATESGRVSGRTRQRDCRVTVLICGFKPEAEQDSGSPRDERDDTPARPGAPRAQAHAAYPNTQPGGYRSHLDLPTTFLLSATVVLRVSCVCPVAPRSFSSLVTRLYLVRIWCSHWLCGAEYARELRCGAHRALSVREQQLGGSSLSHRPATDSAGTQPLGPARPVP